MRYISATVLLLYSSFGPTESNQDHFRETILYRELGDSGMNMYKRIFDTNNKDTVREFFSDPLIRELWPKVTQVLDRESICVPQSQLTSRNTKTAEKANKADLTMRHITNIMINEYKLTLPSWWQDRYHECQNDK